MAQRLLQTTELTDIMESTDEIESSSESTIGGLNTEPSRGSDTDTAEDASNDFERGLRVEKSEDQIIAEMKSVDEWIFECVQSTDMMQWMMLSCFVFMIWLIIG